MFKWLSENPVLAFAAAVSGAVGGINAFTSLFAGLPPFFTDVAAALLALATIVFGASKIRSERAAAGAVWYDPEGRAIRPGGKSRLPLSFLLVAFILVSLAIWNAIPPAVYLRNPAWTVCGTISSKNRGSCYRFSDARKRAVFAGCIQPLDDSGYFRVDRQHWWQYRPDSLTLEQEGRSGPSVELGADFFTPACTAFRKVS